MTHDSPHIVELKKEFRALSEEHVTLQAVIAPERISAAVNRIAEITQRKLIIATEVFATPANDPAEHIVKDLVAEYSK